MHAMQAVVGADMPCAYMLACIRNACICRCGYSNAYTHANECICMHMHAWHAYSTRWGSPSWGPTPLWGGVGGTVKPGTQDIYIYIYILVYIYIYRYTNRERKMCKQVWSVLYSFTFLLYFGSGWLSAIFRIQLDFTWSFGAAGFGGHSY